jgi:hypothetical protein
LYSPAQALLSPPAAMLLQLDCSLLGSIPQQVERVAQVAPLPPLELPELPDPPPLPEPLAHSLAQFCCSQVPTAWPALGQLPSFAFDPQFAAALALYVPPGQMQLSRSEQALVAELSWEPHLPSTHDWHALLDPLAWA